MHFRNISLWQITAWCLLSCQIKNPIYYNFRANLNFRPNIMTFAELHFTRDSCCPCITNTNVVDTSVAIITIAPNFPLILNFLQRIIVKVYKVSQQRMHLIKRFWRQRNTHLLHAMQLVFSFGFCWWPPGDLLSPQSVAGVSAEICCWLDGATLIESFILTKVCVFPHQSRADSNIHPPV